MLGDVTLELAYVDYVLRRCRRELDGAREDHEIVDRHVRHDLPEGTGAPLVLDYRVQKASPMNAIDVRPLSLVLAAEHDAVAVFGLDAEDAAGRQDRMVDLGEPAVGTGNDEIVQDVGAAFCQCGADPELSDLARNETDDMVGDRAKHEREQQSTRDRKQEHGGADAGDPGLDAAFGSQSWQGHERQAGYDSADRFEHKVRIILRPRRNPAPGHVFAVWPG